MRIPHYKDLGAKIQELVKATFLGNEVHFTVGSLDD